MKKHTINAIITFISIIIKINLISLLQVIHLSPEYITEMKERFVNAKADAEEHIQTNIDDLNEITVIGIKYLFFEIQVMINLNLIRKIRYLLIEKICCDNDNLYLLR